MMRSMVGEAAGSGQAPIFISTAMTAKRRPARISSPRSKMGRGVDLAQFRRWYSQAGTPRVAVSQTVEGDSLVLTLRQAIPATPGQPDKLPMPIPLRVAVHSRATGAAGRGTV